MILKELLKHSCVCSLVSATFPSQRPTQHQLCALCMQNLETQQFMLSMAIASLATLLCRCGRHRTLITCIQSSDIYIDMVKLLCGGESLSFSFPAWYLQCGIATLHLRAFLPLKCSVVLRHLINSQGPLIFLQTRVYKLMTHSLSRSNLLLPLLHHSEFPLYIFRLFLYCLLV